MEMEYSDTLLLALLKRFRPNEYRDRQTVEHAGAGGGPIETSLTVTFIKPDPEDDGGNSNGGSPVPG
jgi:hypothetical protein